MSKVFRALEQAERDNAQREPLVPAEPVSERAPIVLRPADATFLNNLVEIGWAETSAEE